MALKPCKECGHQVSSGASACPNCGAKIKRPAGCGTLILILLGLFVILAVIGPCTRTSGVGTTTTPKAPETQPVKELTSEQKLQQASESVERAQASYDARAERLKKYYATAADVAASRDDELKAASAKLAYADSKVPAERALSRKGEALQAKIQAQTRALFASATEESLVKNGLDVRVSVVGKDRKTLRVSYVLMSKPLVYKFQNEGKLAQSAGTAGFKKIIYTNGLDSSLGETWTVDL